MKRLIGLIFLTGLVFSFSCELKKETVMVPSTGKVCLKVEPASAEVYVDGKYMGMTNQFQNNPDCLELSSGKHSIKIMKSGFETHMEDVYVGPGTTQWVSLRLGKDKVPKSSPTPSDKGKGKNKGKGNG